MRKATLPLPSLLQELVTVRLPSLLPELLPVRLPSLTGPVVLGAVLLTGCAEPAAGPVPSASEVESYFVYGRGLEVSVEGTVAEIRAVQPREQLERGGRLWARSGPYVFLFREETRDLFRDFAGLSAVRAVTETPEGEEIARAFLHRNALTDVLWQRALNIAGQARRGGTQRPTLLEDLVEWGEEYTDFEYAPEFQRTS